MLTPPDASAATALAGRLVWRRLGPVALLVAAGLIAWAAGVGDLFSVESLFRRRAWLRAGVAANEPLAVATFVACYLAIGLLAIPGGFLMTMTGGFLFGPLVGGVVSAMGSAGGSFLFFLAARSAAGTLLAQRVGPRLARLQAGFRRDAASYLLFLRFAPLVPFPLVNIAAATLGAPAWTFLWATFVGILPATFAYATAGAGVERALAAQAQAFDACVAAGREGCVLDFSPWSLLTPELLAGLVALALIALLPVIIRRWRQAAARSDGA